MVRVTGIHDNDNPILDSFLTDGEHNLVKLFFTGPFLRLITDKGGNTLDGLQLRRLIPGRGLDTPEHDTTAGHPIYYVRLGGLEILGGAVQFYLFHHLWNDRHAGRYHRVAGV